MCMSTLAITAALVLAVTSAQQWSPIITGVNSKSVENKELTHATSSSSSSLSSSSPTLQVKASTKASRSAAHIRPESLPLALPRGPPVHWAALSGPSKQVKVEAEAARRVDNVAASGHPASFYSALAAAAAARPPRRPSWPRSSGWRRRQLPWRQGRRSSRGFKFHSKKKKVKAGRVMRSRGLSRGRSFEVRFDDSKGDENLIRSMLGVPTHCRVKEDNEDIKDNEDNEVESKKKLHKCLFTPVCWMSGGMPHNDGCHSLLFSCCVLPDQEPRLITGSKSGSKSAKSGLTTRLTPPSLGSLVSESSVSPTPFPSDFKNDVQCGLPRHQSFSKRIIGGQQAKFAELPWQVHIRISSYQCGGVLLNHLYVATAAHCVHQAKLSNIQIHLGEHDTKDTDKLSEPLGSETFRVSEVRLHPRFRYMLTQPDRFDVAVLRLNRHVVYRDNMLPICLPSPDLAADLEGRMGVVAGWGKTDNSFGKTGTNLLNKVLVPIISNDQCRKWHREKSISVQLHKEMFCAGHESGQHDACLGDSGGPMVLPLGKDRRWTLVGITSAGFGCAVEKQPGIYHKVANTAGWIAAQIGDGFV